MVFPRSIVFFPVLLVALGVGQRPFVAIWREGREARSSAALLLRMAGVSSDLRLSAHQRRRIDAIERQEVGDITGFTPLEMVGNVSPERIDGVNDALLAVLNPAQKKRLRSLAYQTLGMVSLFERDLQTRLRLSPRQAATYVKIERDYATQRFGGRGGPIMNDPAPYNDRPDPKARQVLDARLFAVLSPRQRRLYEAARGRIVPSLALITPHTG